MPIIEHTADERRRIERARAVIDEICRVEMPARAKALIERCREIDETRPFGRIDYGLWTGRPGE
jgi:hypothetical protein